MIINIHKLQQKILKDSFYSRKIGRSVFPLFHIISHFFNNY